MVGSDVHAVAVAVSAFFAGLERYAGDAPPVTKEPASPYYRWFAGGGAAGERPR